MPESGPSAGFPPRVAPMLAVPASELPEPESAWAAEFKWDGVRAVAYLSAGRLRLLSRSGRDMTRAYPELADLAHQAGAREMVLDGEIAAFTAGRPSFAALQRRMHVAAPSPRLLAAVPATYLVFDIMDLDGESADRRALRTAAGHPRRPAADRRARACPAVVPRRRDGRARGEHPRWPGGRGGQAPRLSLPARPPLPRLAEDQKPPAPGRGRGRHQPRPGPPGRQIGSLLVGIPGPGGLAYAGRVGTGFTQPELRRLEQLLAPLRRDRPPFAGPVSPAQDVTWVEPRVVIEVSYAELTPDGILRAASTSACRPPQRPRRRDVSAQRPGGRELVRAPGLRAELIGTALLGAELIRCRPPPGRVHRCPPLGPSSSVPPVLGAEQTCARLGLIRRPGIACHVNLLEGCLHRVLPGLGGKDTAWPTSVRRSFGTREPQYGPR